MNIARRLFLPKVRRVATTVMRTKFLGLGDAQALEGVLDLVNQLKKEVQAVASKEHGIAFRFDLADFVIAIAEDENPESRPAGCRAALELFARLTTIDSFAKTGGAKVALAIGMNYGPLLWAPSLGNPGIGAVVSGASELAQRAGSQNIGILASATVIAGLASRFETIRIDEIAGLGGVYQLKGPATI